MCAPTRKKTETTLFFIPAMGSKVNLSFSSLKNLIMVTAFLLSFNNSVLA